MLRRKNKEASADEHDFNGLVGKIQAAAQALRQDALGIVNRSVTTTAWLTGYYIVEFEQGGKVRAEYGDGLLKRLAKRLSDKSLTFENLKKYRRFYLAFPDLSGPVAYYLRERFAKGESAIPQLPQVEHGGCSRQLQTSKETLTSFLKKENEGLFAINGKGDTTS